MRKITKEEQDKLCESLKKLASLMVEMGVIKLKISAANRILIFRLQNGCFIRPNALAEFSKSIEELESKIMK